MKLKDLKHGVSFFLGNARYKSVNQVDENENILIVQYRPMISRGGKLLQFVDPETEVIPRIDGDTINVTRDEFNDIQRCLHRGNALASHDDVVVVERILGLQPGELLGDGYLMKSKKFEVLQGVIIP